MSSAASTSTLLFQDILSQFYARRLLLRAPLYQTPAAEASQPPVAGNSNSIDANVVMVLSVLLCALICSLGLNSIVRCALRCSSFVAANSESRTNPVSARANTGIKKKALKSFPILNYSEVVVKVQAGLGLDTECVICLSEFVPSAKVKLLPKCYHVFHVGCIDKWLNSHSTCPTCRDSLIDTSQKITRGGGCQPATTSSSSATVLQAETTAVTVSIPPLEPEGFTRNYRGSI